MALAENGRADTYGRRAFLYGGFHIVGHSHRQGIQIISCVLQFFKKRFHGIERLPLFFRIGLRFGDRHQSAQFQARHGGNRLDQIGKFFRTDTAFTVFSADIDLKTDIQGRHVIGALVGKPSGDPFTIHGMYPVEMFGNGASLVALYRADEMPFQLQIRPILSDRQNLANRFLFIILAEGELSCFGGLEDGGNRLGFGNSQQIDG